MIGARRGDEFVHSPRIGHATLSHGDLVLVEILAVYAPHHADRADQGRLGDYRGPISAQLEGGQAVVGGFDMCDTRDPRQIFGYVRPVELGEAQVRGVGALQKDREGGLCAPGGRDRAHPDPTGQRTQHNDGQIAAPAAGESCPEAIPANANHLSAHESPLRQLCSSAARRVLLKW